VNERGNRRLTTMSLKRLASLGGREAPIFFLVYEWEREIGFYRDKIESRVRDWEVRVWCRFVYVFSCYSYCWSVESWELRSRDGERLRGGGVYLLRLRGKGNPTVREKIKKRNRKRKRLKNEWSEPLEHGCLVVKRRLQRVDLRAFL